MAALNEKKKKTFLETLSAARPKFEIFAIFGIHYLQKVSLYKIIFHFNFTRLHFHGPSFIV